MPFSLVRCNLLPIIHSRIVQIPVFEMPKFRSSTIHILLRCSRKLCLANFISICMFCNNSKIYVKLFRYFQKNKHFFSPNSWNTGYRPFGGCGYKLRWEKLNVLYLCMYVYIGMQGSEYDLSVLVTICKSVHGT